MVGFSYPDREYGGFPGKGRADWQSEQLYQLVRDLAPSIIMNNRLDYFDVPPDIYTPEQVQPTEWLKVNGKPVGGKPVKLFRILVTIEMRHPGRARNN
jgi:alpha-L-fucosidase